MRRKKKKNGIRIPGKIFEKHVQYGIPEVEGVYLCYYKPSGIPEAVYPVAGLEVSNWYNGKWGTKKQIVAFIGPLPVPLLDELYENKECISTVFYIGTLKGSSQFKFISGPHFQYRIAELQRGKKGRFIFEVDARKTLPLAVSRYDTPTKKWVPIENERKYQLIIRKYQKREK